MAIFKVAKVLESSSTIPTLDNDTLLLSKEEGEHNGIRLSYKNNGSVTRILSPLEEFDRFYKYSDDSEDTNALVNNKENNSGIIEVEGNKSSIVIMDVVDYSNCQDENTIPTIVLPSIDTASINNGIYFSQRVRIVVDRNTKGFLIAVNNTNDKIRTINGILTDLRINKSFTTFDIYSSPDGKWRIIGEYQDNTADVLAMMGADCSIEVDEELPGTVCDSTSWAEVMALMS